MRGNILALAAAAAALLVVSACSKSEQAKTYPLTAEGQTQYLEENKAKNDVKVTDSGLQYRIISSGSGKTPTSLGDTVEVTYKGWTVDGHVFDESPEGQTVEFQRGRVVPGWIEALGLMKEGDEWEISLPSDLAYGEFSPSPDIPPNSVLIFQMKLVKVTPLSEIQ